MTVKPLLYHMKNRVVNTIYTDFSIVYSRQEIGYQFATSLCRYDVAIFGSITCPVCLKLWGNKCGFTLLVTDRDSFSPETSEIKYVFGIKCRHYITAESPFCIVQNILTASFVH